MHGRAVHNQARMVGSPLLNVLALMRAHMVAHEMDGTDALIHLPSHRFPKGDGCPRPLPVITVPIDLASTGVKGRNKIEGTRALRLGRGPVRNVPRRCWLGGGVTRARRQRGLLIPGAPQLIVTTRARRERNERGDRGIAGSVPGRLGIEPDMLAPRLQRMRGQNPTHGRGGDLRHAALSDELPRQCAAIPLRPAATQRIRAFASQSHHGDRDRRGEHCPWPRGQGRRRALPNAERASAWPTSAPPSVGPPPSPPRQPGSNPRPGGRTSSPGAPARRRWWLNAASAPRCHVLRGTAEYVMRPCGHGPS
jgi:hypothetical protein